MRSDLPQLQWLHRLTAQAGDAGRGRGERQAAAEREGRLAPKPGNGLCKPKGRKGPPTHGPTFTDRIYKRIELDWIGKGWAVDMARVTVTVVAIQRKAHGDCDAATPLSA